MTEKQKAIENLSTILSKIEKATIDFKHSLDRLISSMENWKYAGHKTKT